MLSMGSYLCTYTNYNYQYVVMHVCQLLKAGGWRGACIGHCEVATVVSSAFIKVSKYVYT
jgi:hypothetical protein